jgi:hypothetical protein
VSGCTIFDCGREVVAFGMCWAHYARQRRGQPVYVYLQKTDKRVSTVRFGPARPTRAQRAVMRDEMYRWLLDNEVTWEPNTGCALWLGRIFPSGYGVLGYARRDPWGGYAHRAALYFSGTALQNTRALHVRHSCDQPSCINTRHLAYGPALENVRDRDLRGRNGVALLTAEAAREVASALVGGRSPKSIAGEFNIAVEVVYRIRSGRSYGWAMREAA